MLCFGRDDDYVAVLHSGPFSSDQRLEFTFDDKEGLLTSLMCFGLFSRRLTRSERHYRRLTVLGRLKNFEPAFRPINVGALRFHHHPWHTL